MAKKSPKKSSKKAAFYTNQRKAADKASNRAARYDNDDGDRAPFEKGEAMSAKIHKKLSRGGKRGLSSRIAKRSSKTASRGRKRSSKR